MEENRLNKVNYRLIGKICSPYKDPRGTPIQPTASKDTEGIVEVFPEYVDGLKDIDGFSHIILVYHFHLSKGYSLKIRPFLDDKLRGVFATRAPSRPNPIGISIVRLVKVEGNILYIQGIDIIDGTPLLDIKPYVPEFDVWKVERIGWLENKITKLREVRDDGRFAGVI
jgi:tRNA-Thr(GGU) m(6)t(6)A37 methyltransferase TsaA